MESATLPKLGRPAPVLGTEFEFEVPVTQSPGPPRTICIVNDTSPGVLSPEQVRNLAWSARYALSFFFNRSTWVQRHIVPPIGNVVLLSPAPVGGVPTVAGIPDGAWVLDLLDTCEVEGALGLHEGHAHTSKAGPAGAHSLRGRAIVAGTPVVLMKIGVQTTLQDNAPVGEVITHEAFEAAVDPFVDNEDEVRTYLNPADGKERIGEVGDPVQERAFDVGAPEGRPCGVPEALISDFAELRWFGQQQSRPGVCFTQDTWSWRTLPSLPPLGPWEVGAGGYMSLRDPGGEWQQVYGAKARRGPDPE